MSTDGHGFIGRLALKDGTCLNVSLPDELSEQLINREPTMKTVTGRMFPYVKESDILVTLNGRRIGEGLCGSNYLFVR